MARRGGQGVCAIDYLEHMDADAGLRALLARHNVTIERLDPIPVEWHALVDEAVVRMLASGWRNRHIAQVKEKFASLRIHVDRTGESEAFLDWARCITAEVLARSLSSNAVSAVSLSASTGERSDVDGASAWSSQSQAFGERGS